MTRVLRQSDCHMVLLGRSGSGRLSCVRLAAHITQTEMLEINVTSETSFESWRQEWKNQLHNALIKISHSNSHVIILIRSAKVYQVVVQ